VYRRLVEGAADIAQFMLDPEGCVSLWPEVAERLYGYESEDVLGDRFDVLFADSRQTPANIEDLLADAEDGPVTTEGWHERADGSVFWATCTLSPLRNGEFDGYVVTSRDTTSRKQYERMLERQNDRLKEFTDILAHDLRTPLSVIDGRLELYRTSGSTSRPSRRRPIEWRGSSRTCSASPNRGRWSRNRNRPTSAPSSKRPARVRSRRARKWNTNGSRRSWPTRIGWCRCSRTSCRTA
jgi:PAS domain S-box-containing protein